MDENISVKNDGWGISVITKTDKGQTVFFCRDIRGALVWPTLNSPGYYCIFAQRNDATSQGKLPLHFLGEVAAELPKQVFQKLVEHSKKLACREFYHDYQEQNEELIRAFYEYCRYQRISNIQFTRAAFAKSFHIGISLIKEWAKDNALKVPEGTILRDQLKDIGTVDLTEKPEEKFFAVNALRLLIGSFEKNPQQPPSFFGKQRDREKRDPGGWT